MEKARSTGDGGEETKLDGDAALGVVHTLESAESRPSLLLWRGPRARLYALSASAALKVVRAKNTVNELQLEHDVMRELSRSWNADLRENAGPFQGLTVLGPDPGSMGTVGDYRDASASAYSIALEPSHHPAYTTERLQGLGLEERLLDVSLDTRADREVVLGLPGADLDGLCYEAGRFVGVVERDMRLACDKLSIVAARDTQGRDKFVIVDIGSLAARHVQESDLLRIGPSDDQHLMKLFRDGYAAGARARGRPDHASFLARLAARYACCYPA